MICSGLPRRVAPIALALASLACLGCPFSPHTMGEGPLSSDTDGGADGGSTAIPCLSDAECPKRTEPCAVAACVDGVCSMTPVAAGPVGPIYQVLHDCRNRQCDGKGSMIEVPDDSDTPDDHGPCIVSTCSEGAKVSMYVERYKAAPGCDGGKACDGAGQCLLIDFTACAQPSECVSGACYKQSVSSSGGVCKRANGDTCAAPEECDSNVCNSGQCAACSDQNCGEGSCLDGKCYKKCPAAPDACAAGYTCSVNICVDNCSASPCTGGYACINSICVKAP